MALGFSYLQTGCLESRTENCLTDLYQYFNVNMIPPDILHTDCRGMPNAGAMRPSIQIIFASNSCFIQGSGRYGRGSGALTEN